MPHDESMSIPTQQPQQHARQLRRPFQDRAFAGVAAGLGQRFNVSPAWFRVAFILLALAGGVGFVLYGIGWILIPDEGSNESIAEGWVDGFDASNSAMVIGVVLIGMASVILVSSLRLVSGKFVVAAVLLVLGVLLYRGDLTRSKEPSDPEDSTDPESPIADDLAPESIDDDDATPAPPDGGDGEDGSTEPGGADTAAPVAAGAVAAGGAGAMTAVAAPARPPKPRPPKPRSILGQLTLAATLIAVGGLALLDVADVLYPDPVHYLAVAVGVIGGGLLVGTLFGRARWLIFIGLFLAPFLFVASFVSEWSFSGEAGERYIQVTSIEDLERANYSYDHSFGSLELDLRWFEVPAEASGVVPPISIDARVSAGELRIRLPQETGAVVTGSAGMGSVKLFGDESAGIGVSNTAETGDKEPNVVFTIYARADFGTVVVDVPLENEPRPPEWEE
jgi:phage shock protein PspC (stress-responsive transcriptional regulator)